MFFIPQKNHRDDAIPEPSETHFRIRVISDLSYLKRKNGNIWQRGLKFFFQVFLSGLNMTLLLFWVETVSLYLAVKQRHYQTHYCQKWN